MIKKSLYRERLTLPGPEPKIEIPEDWAELVYPWLIEIAKLNSK